MLRYFTFWLLLLVLNSCDKEVKHEKIFDFIDPAHSLLREIFNHPEYYEVQIRYTQVDRDAMGFPLFRTYSYQYDSALYFYPASTVKMPVAFLAIEKINDINEGQESGQLSRNSTIITDRSREVQTPAFTDSTSSSLLPSLGHYIDKVFVVSDNDAYNRLYEFCGQDYINQKLREKGIFTNSRIVHRVGAPKYSTKENRYTNAIKFLDQNGQSLFEQPAQKGKEKYNLILKNTKKGKGYYIDSSGLTILEPFDMSEKNFINLRDLEQSLMRVVFPETYKESEKYHLNQNQYQYLYKSMLRLPKDYSYLMDDTTSEYHDGYVKFFIYGDSKEDIPSNIHIMNKVGYAYGYLTDCAYIFDTTTGVEFFLTATVHVNANRIYNDGIYEYEDLGIPFLAELGRQIFSFEENRERVYKPRFSNFLEQLPVH